MKKIIFILLLLFSETVFASWSVKELNEDINVDGDSLTISHLQFKSATGETVIFKPSAEPFILSEVKKYEIDGKAFFLSTWVGGAASIGIRVFNPEISELPLCQDYSDAETSDLRKNKDTLEMKVTSEVKGKPKTVWVPCHKLQGRVVNGKVEQPKVNSPAKKNLKK